MLPLSGVRVLDFTWVVAGPYATRVLADLGAEIIKVQSRLTMHMIGNNNTVPLFLHLNRNKRGIQLNMGQPEARALARRLVGLSDLVIDNFSARVMGQWGLDYPGLAAVRPDIIQVNMAGMGHSGPWKDHVTFGPTLQALSGFTSWMAYPDGDAVGFSFSYSDTMGGAMAAVAALMALEHRGRTGRGQRVDFAQFESLVSLLGPALLDLTVNGRAPRPLGNRDPDRAPQGIYPCAPEDDTDRWVALTCADDADWQRLRELLGDPEWARDPALATVAGRQAAHDQIDAELARWTREQVAEALAERLQAAGIAASIVQTGVDLWARDPQLAARGQAQPAPHATLGAITGDGLPFRLDGARPQPWRAAPILGQDNAYVFGELLGLSAADIADLEAREVIY